MVWVKVRHLPSDLPKARTRQGPRKVSDESPSHARYLEGWGSQARGAGADFARKERKLESGRTGKVGPVEPGLQREHGPAEDQRGSKAGRPRLRSF